ncbi:MAG TPA: alpha-hydroxy acid oxidase [Solirubrobacter sp.]|nr:alpha-hydroxy acid oxidase [Solirubrobacter sp.]
MRLSEIPSLVSVKRPPAPYGVRKLERCVAIDDLAALARRNLPSGAWAYLEGGGEGEYTLRRNRAAFDALELLPHVLGDVSDVDTATTVLGGASPLPIVLSPVGAPRMFHHEGELAVARAAGHAGIPYAVSTMATVSVEAIAAQTAAPLGFQLYVWGDRGEARGALARARAAGYRVLLLSVDTSVRSKRERELHAGLSLPTPQLTLRTLADGALHPGWAWHFMTSRALDFPNIGPGGAPSRAAIEDMFDGTVSWDDLDWIRDAWDGPVGIKGVLRADEAARAADEGLDAVVVSNHGGRQLDHVPATIDVLPEIVEAVDGRLEVLLDSGIRRGSDIAAALALGARAVLVGRAHLYGLAAAGEAGVRHAIDILGHELRMTMALCGAATLSGLDPELVRARRVPLAS